MMLCFVLLCAKSKMAKTKAKTKARKARNRKILYAAAGTAAAAATAAGLYYASQQTSTPVTQAPQWVRTKHGMRIRPPPSASPIEQPEQSFDDWYKKQFNQSVEQTTRQRPPTRMKYGSGKSAPIFYSRVRR
tara:strand:+ start:369 stop:764 length:396 start_codon:yes stop_codon:yes gene_type:complete